VLSQGIGKILFFCSKISSPLPLGTLINYCGLQTKRFFLLEQTKRFKTNSMLAMISMVFDYQKKNINSHNQYLDYFLRRCIAICGFCYAFVYQIAIGLSKNKITCIFQSFIVLLCLSN
jgi:hypothetical protein